MSGFAAGGRAHRQWIGCVIIFLMTWALTTIAAADEPKLAPPTMMAQLGALKTVQDVYKEDLATAKTPELKKVLTRKLVEDSKGEKGINRYALLATAIDLAGETGDLAGALLAIDAIDASFTIDALKMKSDAATNIAKTARTPDDRKNFVEQIRVVIAATLAVDRYDLARSMAETALSVARSTTDADLARRASAEAQQVRDLESAYADVKKSLAVLADTPTDPEANLKVGKFRCLTKGDWDAGLPMLALGSDEALKALAERELSGITVADDQAKLADGWWEYAESLTGPAKNTIRSHAAKWYTEAAPTMSKGFLKLKAESRIKDVLLAEAKAEAGSLLDKPRINVVKAVYGTAKKNTDITKKLAGIVTDVGLIFSADNTIAGDPAPGDPKQMAISYTLQGQSAIKRLGEGELCVLLGPIRTERKGTVVIKAFYGAGCTWKNVTSIVQGAVTKKIASIPITDDVLTGDPKFEAQKFLVVIFAVDGKPAWISARMGEALPLPLKIEAAK